MTRSARVARPCPEKKREPTAPTARRVLPMQLQHATADRKNAHVHPSAGDRRSMSATSTDRYKGTRCDALSARLSRQRRRLRSNSTYPRLQPETITRVLPTQLRIGDRLVDESGEWQVLARLYTTAGGKSVNVPVQRADNQSVTAIRVWDAHERVSVKRSSAEEGKR
jgi:hypothetical protein